MSYWIISVPTEKKNEDETRRRLSQGIGTLAKAQPFKIPGLKVGTLDALMNLSDKLGKVDTIVEGITKKLERAHVDVFHADPGIKKDEKKEEKVEEGGSKGEPELRIDQKYTPAEYVEKFTWNAMRYNPKRDLAQITDTILEAASKIDDQLKKTMSEYNECKSSLGAIERRETGTLLVKPLGQFITKDTSGYIIEKEWITTLIVVVPVVKEKEFLGEYEILEKLNAQKEEAERKRKEEMAKAMEEMKQQKSGNLKVEKKTEVVEDDKKGLDNKHGVSPLLEKKEKKVDCSNVVPGSAKKLTPEGYEGEFCLYRILVLRKGAEAIKNLCREKRYTVRPFKYDPEEEKSTAADKKKLGKQLDKLWKFLVQWTKTQYAEVFSSWIHIKAMKVYVESVLRFGLPVDVQVTILEPKKGKDPQLRLKLKELYQNLPNAGLATELDPGETDISGFGSDFYPYVYAALKISESAK